VTLHRERERETSERETQDTIKIKKVTPERGEKMDFAEGCPNFGSAASSHTHRGKAPPVKDSVFCLRIF
jgi:hypothetical protein